MAKKVLLAVTAVGVALTIWFYSAPLHLAYSQGEIEVKCGQIIDREFASKMEEHIYFLSIEPRWSFDVSVVPYGDDLQTIIALYGPTDKRIAITDGGGGFMAGIFTVSKLPSVSSGVLSSRGPYKIRVANEAMRDNRLYEGGPGGVGYYTLKIGCTSDDGTKIKPGEILQSTPTSAPISTATTQSAQPNPTSPSPQSGLKSLSFLTIGQSYEVTFGSQTKIVKLIELTDEGWAKIEVNGGVGWLNLYQVALIIPLD